MKDTDQLESSIESLEIYENKKQFALKGLVVNFIVWQLSQITLNNFADFLNNTLTIAFHFLNILGAIGWAGFIFYLIKISSLLKGNSNLYSQINDERMSLVRLRSMSYGFCITLGVTALFFGASTLVDSFAQNLEFSGTFVAQSIFLIAVTSCMISYLILDNNE